MLLEEGGGLLGWEWAGWDGVGLRWTGAAALQPKIPFQLASLCPQPLLGVPVGGGRRRVICVPNFLRNTAEGEWGSEPGDGSEEGNKAHCAPAGQRPGPPHPPNQPLAHATTTTKLISRFLETKWLWVVEEKGNTLLRKHSLGTRDIIIVVVSGGGGEE